MAIKTAPVWVQTENGFVIGTLNLSTEWDSKPLVKLPGDADWKRVKRDLIQEYVPVGKFTTDRENQTF